MQTREADERYYQELVTQVAEDTNKCKEEIKVLSEQLDCQKRLKSQKIEFEDLCRQIDQFEPAQETTGLISQCEQETARLTAECASEHIHAKQKQLSLLVSLLRDFQ